MTNPDTLSEDIQDALEEFCNQGNEALDENEFEEAAVFFEQALAVLPEPAEEWEPWGWIQGALGDAHYGMQDYTRALEYFQNAYTFAGPEEVTPFVLLRLGQCCRRIGDNENAAKYLHHAYMLEGEGIFDDEAADLTFLKKSVSLS